MSGYVMAFGPCIRCGRVFVYNPLTVPSTCAITGKRDPLCRPCIEHINAIRRECGIEPHQIAPDAYDACDESELP